jgi:hypothetical protein
VTVALTAAGDDAPAQVAYEALRGRAIAGAVSGGFGLVVLRREGLAAWVARRSTDADPITAVPSDPHGAGVPRVSDDVHAGRVRVLASMALGHWRKESNV